MKRRRRVIDDESDEEAHEPAVKEHKQLRKISRVRDDSSEEEDNECFDLPKRRLFKNTSDSDSEDDEEDVDSDSDSAIEDSDEESEDDEPQDVYTQFSSELEDDFKRKLWLSFVIQVEYHANELNDPDNFDSDDEYDQLKTNFKELGRHVEDKISSLASSYDSSAWKQDFRNNLIEATSYSVGHEQDHGKCDACGRSSNSSRIRIKLVDEDEVSKYDIGYDCMAKTYSFHTVYHFKTHLIDKIASRLESVSLEEFMEDADWIWREFNRFNHLMSHSQLHYENIRDENAVQIEEEECVQVQATVSTQSYHSSISIEKIKEYEKKKITGKEFQNVKNELLLHYYHQFNDNVFGGRLPNIRVITSAASETDPHLTWNPRLTTTAGRANLFTRGGRYTGGIELSSQVINGIVRLQSTLAHEMCHLATYINHHGSAGHGKLFFQYGNLITRKYGHITVSTCHSYKIPTKFVYKCMRCGDEFPRQRQVEYGTTCRCLGELMMFRYETK